MQETSRGQDYHTGCLRVLFGSDEVPEMDYRAEDLYTLAEKVVSRRVTVPGVQAKLSMEIQHQAREARKLTIVGLWGRFILKPPSNRWPELPENEHCTMRMAEVVGIETVPSGLIHLKSGEPAFITRRIDRTDEGEKLAMEDLCQLSGRLTEDKYKGSHEQIAKIIKRYVANPIFDIVRFFEVVLFSYLTGNGDMHLKNFSLFQDPQIGWKFSASYDLLSTRLIIPEQVDSEELALTLNGKKSRFRRGDFEQFGRSIGLTSKQIANEFSKMEDRQPLLRKLIEESFLSEQMKEKYRELLERNYAKLLK